MGLTSVFFWLLSAMALLAACGVVLSRNPISSVLWLIVVFFSISGHYVLMNAQFLAIVNIIVYAGAIMVLFLFVIMLMNLNKEVEPKGRMYMKLAGMVSGLSLLLIVVAAAAQTEVASQPLRPGTPVGLIKNLGQTLFNDYVVPFEIASILFLSAMVGAIILSKKNTNHA